MDVIFSELAAQELNDGINYYEALFDGLGARFKKEVYWAVKRILEYPSAWSIELGEVRKCLLHKFPYKLLYSIEDTHIFIVAVANLHRKPDYWIDEDE